MTRALYARTGGDPFVAGRLPALFRAAGLELELFEPHVLVGGPGSDVFRWADTFFPGRVGGWVEEGLMTPAERAAFDADWAARKRDPDARFFSPIVVCAAARKPG